jgi:Leucine-rich repeat (LRR) protein
MPKLAGLNIGRTQVTDLEPIRTLTGLENLDISDCHVADLLPLLELPNLRNLDLARCKLIKRLKPMQVLIERLESLTIIGCELDDVPEKFCGRGWRTNNFVSEVRDHLRSLDCSAGPKTELTNSPSAVNAASLRQPLRGVDEDVELEWFLP